MVATLLVALALAQGPGATEAKLTGVWSAVMTTPDGQQRETIYEFKAESGRLTGKVYMLFGAQDIVDGKIDGESFSFATVMRMGEQERRMLTEGRIVGEQLTLKRVMPAGAGPPPGTGAPPGAGGGMRMPTEMTARKLSPEEAKKR